MGNSPSRRSSPSSRNRVHPMPTLPSPSSSQSELTYELLEELYNLPDASFRKLQNAGRSLELEWELDSASHIHHDVRAWSYSRTTVVHSRGECVNPLGEICCPQCRRNRGTPLGNKRCGYCGQDYFVWICPNHECQAPCIVPGKSHSKRVRVCHECDYECM